MDGYDATKAIRDVCDVQGVEHPYIVACTGHTENQYVDLAFKSKFDEVVAKPAKIDILEVILKESLVIERAPSWEFSSPKIESNLSNRN